MSKKSNRLKVHFTLYFVASIVGKIKAQGMSLKAMVKKVKCWSMAVKKKISLSKINGRGFSKFTLDMETVWTRCMLSFLTKQNLRFKEKFFCWSGKTLSILEVTNSSHRKIFSGKRRMLRLKGICSKTCINTKNHRRKISHRNLRKDLFSRCSTKTRYTIIKKFINLNF